MTAQWSDVIVEFKNVHIQIRQKTILENVSFQIHKGEWVYLIGKTGAGKSSLLRVIFGDLRPVAGEVRVRHFDLACIERKNIPFLRRQLGIVFQDFQLLPDRTVAENLAFVMRATGWKNSKKIKERIAELLMQVGLATKIHYYPHQLSGGEQQRTAIARALINEPIILLADEPTGNLDPEITLHIMELLQKINRNGTAVLMATHDYPLIQRFPARVLECIAGRVIERK
ncbi:MAG: ATP-binding cassette domain-containing protein [Bacteroidia bacterium]|nr:ATP-binding cassette domain-containing protein [Bacteroidia bacterium]MDW8159622.1 ATP-binding cassette domain-containing protein [Bacteroidia bacterium]